MLAIKLAFVACLIAVFAAGIFTFRNFEKWFGPDLTIPSENESARFINKSQIVLIWLLAMKLMVMMVWIL